MRRAARFLVVLVVGLALLTSAGYFAVTRVTRDWFDKDLRLRTQLAVASARQSLTTHWSGDRQRLTENLADITRDERIMAAAACSPEGSLLAATQAYPHEFSCRAILGRVHQETSDGIWTMTTEFPAAGCS